MPLNPNISLAVKGIELQDPLAQYGKVAAIQGAQRQSQVADMQLEALRRDRDALSQIQAAIVSKGGPANLSAAADAMIKTGKPEYVTQGMEILQKLKAQDDWATYQKQFGFGATTGATGMPTATPAASTAPANLSPINAMAPVGTPAAPTAPANLSPINAMAPVGTPAASTAPANALVGQPDVAALEARYNMVANIDTPGAKAEAALLLKKIDRAATATPADIKTMQSLGYPITQAGWKAFRDAYRSDRLLTPEEEAQKIRIGRQTRAITTINNVQEKAEAGAFGKMLVDQYNDISKQAMVGARSKPAIDANLAILDKGFDTGFATETKAAGAKILGALGVQDAEKYATNSQTFLANASQAVLQRQLEQKGPQTEADAQRITQTGAQLGNTKKANRFVLSVAKEQINRDIEQRKFYDNWRKKTGSFQGAEDAWYAGEGGRSLFDRPSLKKYLPQEAQTLKPDRRQGLSDIFKPYPR